METKVDNPILETKVITLLGETENPVSIDFVRHHLALNWSTTRALLFSLALEGKIRSQKTSKSWIFWVENEKEVK